MATEKIDWRKSEARVVMKNDLRSGVLPLNKEDCPAQEAWEVYRHHTAFKKVPYSQFRDRLRSHRKQEKQSREGISEGEEKRKSKPKKSKEKKIDWKISKAREIIVEDLHKGDLSLDNTEVSAEVAWVKYKQYEAFSNVPFSQFKTNLEGHREQERKARAARTFEEAAMERDRRLYPRKYRNHRGKLEYDLSDAKPFLRDDVKAGKHNLMSVEQLWRSRQEYCHFTLAGFRPLVKQEIRRWKMVNTLELKRANKAEEMAKKRVKAAVKEAKEREEMEDLIKQAEQAWKRKREVHPDLT